MLNIILFPDEEAAKKNPRYHLKSVNAETQSILDELETSYKAPVRRDLMFSNWSYLMFCYCSYLMLSYLSYGI